MPHKWRYTNQRELGRLRSFVWLRSRAEQQQLKGEIEQFIPPLLILIQDLYNPGHVCMEDWEQPVSEERLEESLRDLCLHFAKIT